MGILPSIKFLSKNPEKDRPALWIVFSFGYFLSMFAITEHTFANWILPVFMTLAPALVWIHLVKYRVKNKIPLKEWI
jgi:cytochrome c-type biogenesis protein CcmH/NrfF